MAGAASSCAWGSGSVSADCHRYAEMDWSCSSLKRKSGILVVARKALGFCSKRDPVLVELEANFLEIRADFLHVLQEAFVSAIELNDAQVEFAVGDFEGDGAIVEAIGVFVALRSVSLLHEVVGLLEVIFLFLIDELDLLGDGE